MLRLRALVEHLADRVARLEGGTRHDGAASSVSEGTEEGAAGGLQGRRALFKVATAASAAGIVGILAGADRAAASDPNDLTVGADTTGTTYTRLFNSSSFELGNTVGLLTVHDASSPTDGEAVSQGAAAIRGDATRITQTGVMGAATRSGGHGVQGYSSGSSGFGVTGSAPSGTGVWATGGTRGVLAAGPIAVEANSSTTWGMGVHGSATGTSGVGVRGYASSTAAKGVEGESAATNGIGVGGRADGTSGRGVDGFASNTGGIGVRGSAAFDAAEGVVGEADVPSGRGVTGTSNGVSGIGVSGVTTNTSAVGVSGSATGYAGKGVNGNSAGSDGIGTKGAATGVGGVGVWGEALVSASIGVLGYAPVGGSIGVQGNAPGTGGTGVKGFALDGVAVAGSASSGIDVAMSGTGLLRFSSNAGTGGPPASGAHQVGEMGRDNTGALWYCVASGTPGTWQKVSGPTAAGAFHLLANPARFVDSFSGKRTPAGSWAGTRTVTLGGQTEGLASIPPGATGVVGTVTNYSPSAFSSPYVTGGYCSVFPASASVGPVSNIYAGGQMASSSLFISALSADAVKVYHHVASHLTVDLVGYYL